MSTRTGYRSSAPFASSAARSPTRRVFPPRRLQTALKTARAELVERLNPKRHRTNPRAVKRARHNSYRVKRPTDVGFGILGHPPLNSSPSPKVSGIGSRDDPEVLAFLDDPGTEYDRRTDRLVV